MKEKFIFILILFSMWISNAQTERYHRLRSLGTSLEQSELDNACNNNSFNNKPLAKWNVTTIHPLINRRIYKIFIDDEIKYYWVEQSFSYATDDDGASINANNILDIIQCPDADNDGVPDIRDNCPNQPGASSNNGCPIVDSDNDGIPDQHDSCPNVYGSSSNGCPTLPNLTLESLKINVTNQGNFNTYPNGEIPTFRYNSSTQFEIKIKNNGQSNSGNFACALLVSGAKDAYPTTNGFPVYNFQVISFSNINGNSSSSKTITQTIYNYIGGLDLEEGQTYYMYLHIDSNDDVTESSDGNNNVHYFSFKYNNPNNKFSNSKKNQMLPLTNQNSIKENYNINIYGFSGVLMKSIKSSSIEEEKNIIKNLSPGMYIIKTPSETKKIIK